MATGFIWVAGDKQNNHNSSDHCLLQNENNSTRNITDEELDRDENSVMVIPLKHAKQRAKDDAGNKRDNTFTDLLKNLLSMVDTARKNSDTVTFPNGNPAQGMPSPSSSPYGPPSSVITPIMTTPSSPTPSSPLSSQPTSKATPAPAPVQTTSPQSIATTSAQPTNPLEPGKNFSAGPGIVITPGGAIILKPPFPILPGPRQGGTNPPGVFPAMPVVATSK